VLEKRQRVASQTAQETLVEAKKSLPISAVEDSAFITRSDLINLKIVLERRSASHHQQEGGFVGECSIRSPQHAT
jgi:hypothetical protein